MYISEFGIFVKIMTKRKKTSQFILICILLYTKDMNEENESSLFGLR